jgi:hypothetical protein
MESYLSVKTSQMVIGKVYYHYSSRFNNTKWVRLVDYLGDSDYMSVISSDHFNYISDDDLVQRYASMKWDDRIEFHRMINDDTVHPYSIIAERCKININDLNSFSYLRFSQPRKEFYDSEILLEVLDIEQFPFKIITAPKLSEYTWKKDFFPNSLNKNDIRDIKINHIL